MAHALASKPDDRPNQSSKLSGASVLVVDDEYGMRNFLAKTLGPQVARFAEASSPEEATKRLDDAHFDIIILDNIMCGQTGLQWVADQKQQGLFSDIIMITAYADLETAISALRVGVTDFVLKPFRANQILGAVDRTLDRKFLRRDNTLLRREIRSDIMRGPLLGHSPAMEQIRDVLAKVADLPTPVLFTGASGTGKELAARHLHQISDRAKKPFVPVNCAAIEPDRISTELFGCVEHGELEKPGLLMLADGGILFLDEIAMMPEQVQAVMLRVLEDCKIRAVGAEREVPLDVRFLFATNSDLKADVEQGKFRADLYHRINVMRLDMPPLSQRSEDIVELASFFISHFSKLLGMPALELSDETLLRFRRYAWPGNVRELRNLIERSVILGEFPAEFAGNPGGVVGEPAIENLEMVVQRHILHMLDLCNGNRSEAARRLSVSRKTIDRKLALWSNSL
jgi:DNA-binding NtrC family response regulator